MTTTRSSGQDEIVYLHFRFELEPTCTAVPGGTQVPFVRTPLPTSELKTAVTTGCRESGSPFLDVISLIG